MADTNTYRIVSANDHLYDTLDIQTQVNELMAKGWEPIGGATKMGCTRMGEFGTKQ
jgi:hypothetical protein